MTTLVTPLSYEGLIDSIYGIKAGIAYVPAESGGMAFIDIADDEGLFGEIRSRPFESIGPVLQSRAKTVKLKYDKFRDNKEISISEMHRCFVTKEL